MKLFEMRTKFRAWVAFAVMVLWLSWDLYSSEFSAVDFHESAHQYIFAYYGYNSTKKINLDLIGITIPEGNITTEDWHAMRPLHVMNELLEIHFTPIRILLRMIFYALCVISLLLYSILTILRSSKK